MGAGNWGWGQGTGGGKLHQRITNNAGLSRLPSCLASLKSPEAEKTISDTIFPGLSACNKIIFLQAPAEDKEGGGLREGLKVA